MTAHPAYAAACLAVANEARAAWHNRPTLTLVQHPYALSTKQVRIMPYLTEGMTDANIARELHISPNGVKWHIHEILLKMGCINRTQAAVRWVREQE